MLTDTGPVEISVPRDRESTIVLMPRVGPKTLVAAGILVAAGAAMAWFAQLGVHTAYAAACSARSS